MNFSVSERALPESFAYPERGGVSLRGLSQADEPRVSAGLASPDSDPEEVRLTKRRVFRTYYGIFAVCAVFLFVQPFAYADHAVNINIADKATLMTLTGIGDVKAQAIIDYRTEHGPFATIEDIKNVSGIGEVTFNNIKDHITVSGGVSQTTEDEPQEDTQTEQTQTSSDTSTTYETSDMKLTAQAGENRTVTIGTDVPFIGLAHDDKKKPMENVHYTWNFGDGTTAEGKEVTHRFLYSGRYAVVLKVFHYGAYATHRITVVAEEVELTLALSEDGGVVLSNKGRRNADISLWRVVMDFHTFTLPEHTVILPGATLRLSPTLLRFHAAAKAELQFPSGAVAVRVKEVEKTEPPKTAHTAIEPFVSETKAPSSRVSLTPSVSVHTSESEVETNTEFEAESVATTTQLAAASTADTRVSYAWWLGAALISLLGAGAVYAIRRKQKDDWKIIDESAG